MALDDIKKINDEINKLRAELGKKPLKPFDENDLERAKSLLSGLSAEVREMGNDLDYVYKSFKDSVNELSKQNRYLSDSRKSLNGISDISKKIIDYRRGETSLDEKTLQNLKKKASSQFNELQRIKDIGNLSEKNRGEVEKALADQELFNEEVDKTIAAQKEVNKQIGLVGTGIEGISKGLSKMGFGNLSQPLTEAIQKTKDVRLQMELNKNVINDINKLQEFQNKGYQNLSFSEKNLYSQLKLRYSTDKDAQEKQKESLKSQNTELSTQTSKYKNIGIALKDQLTTANLIDFAIQQMVSALIKADTQTGQLAKAFGTSYSEAASMRNELNTVANLSGDVNITTGALQESLIALNKEFGTAGMLNKGLLEDFTNMTKVMGYTDEAAAKLSKITAATGTDLSDNTAQILGTAAAFNVTNDLALNEKEIVEGVAKASAAVTVSLGMQPKAIAAAVIQAKALGLELEQVEGIAKSLLNFESSISNELEAELLTGRSLNLEQARYYALTNNVEGVAREIAKQNITAAEYTGMNSIAAEALAKSLGLSREELAQSLINQEALNKAGMTGKTTQEAYAALKEKGLSDDQIAEKLGNKILAQQMKSQSVQDRFNASVEKLQELFVSVAEPILQIVSPFMDLATTILPLVNIALMPIAETFKLLGGYGKEILGTIAGVYAIQKLMSGLNSLLIFQETAKNTLTTTGLSLNEAILTSMGFQNAVAGYQLAKAQGMNTLRAIGVALEETILGSIIAQGIGIIRNIGKLVIENAARLTGMTLAMGTNAATTFGIGVAVAVAAAAAGIAAIKSIKDGVIDPNKGVVVSGGFGSVQLNEKDTFVGDKNGIKAGTNLFGNTAQSITSPTITINTDPLAREMQAVTKALEKLFDKDSNVYLDGAKIGKGIKQASSKIG
jgi:hypothetical protein